MNPVIELRRMKPQLGTFVEISVGGIRRERLLQAVSRAFDTGALIQRLMSFHDADSETNSLNREARRAPVQVHAYTYQVLKMAKRIWSATGGLFDCTVAPTLMEWGYLPRHLSAAGNYGGDSGDIELQPDRRVRFRRPICIDLGGVAKGFSVDQMVKSLKNDGVPYGCVNAGGDLRFFGNREYPLQIRLPGAPHKFMCVGRFRETAVATSAPYFSAKQFRKRRVSPLIHPASGKPMIGRRSVSLFAPDCLIADALTKAVILDPDFPQPVLRQFQASAVVLSQSGGVLSLNRL